MVLYVQIERLLFQRLQAPSYTNIYKTSFKHLTYFCAAIGATIICYICRRDKARQSFSIVNLNESTEVYRASETIFFFLKNATFFVWETSTYRISVAVLHSYQPLYKSHDTDKLVQPLSN